MIVGEFRTAILVHVEVGVAWLNNEGQEDGIRDISVAVVDGDVNFGVTEETFRPGDGGPAFTPPQAIALGNALVRAGELARDLASGDVDAS